MSIKSEIASLSVGTAQKISIVVDQILEKLEIALKGRSVIIESDKLYIADTSDFQITDRYGKESALNKLVEWEVITYKLTEQGNYLVSSTLDEIRKVKVLLLARLTVFDVHYKLTFYAGDGSAEYKDIVKPLKGKMRVLAAFLEDNKNIRFSLNDINRRCTPFFFKNHKALWDAVDRIKTKLEVAKNDYFPIKVQGSTCIWAE